MLQKIAFAGFGVILLASPLLASADTASDLQAKRDSLLIQATQLRAELATVIMSEPISLLGAACPRLGRRLAFGARGDDVAGLQKVLIAAGVLADGSATGFFGPLTQAAVQKLQAANGIVSRGSPATTGWGAVGPMTRSWIARWCGGNRNFSASPTSGPAPLAVTFSVKGAREVDFTQGYTIDFGDGSSDKVNIVGQALCTSGSTTCNPNRYGNSHTYTPVGTYIAKLMGPGVCAPGRSRPANDPDCTLTQIGAPVTIGTVTIRVGTQTDNPPPPSCQLQNIICPAGTHHVYGPGKCEVRCVDDGAVGTPSITGIDGPAAIGTGQTGLWTVRASVPSNADTSLRYSVIWGDEGVFDQIKAFAGPSASALQASGTFTHAYASSGTFRPTFTVTNDAGSAQTSISVVVGKDTTQLNCPQYMAPLCSASETLVGGGYGSDGCQLSPRCVSSTSTSNTSTSGTFSATPATGTPPLIVTFTGVGNNISFGDDGPTLIAGGNASLGTVTHVYRNFDEYTATSDGRSVNISVTPDKLRTYVGSSVLNPSNLCVYNNRTYTPGSSVDVPTKTCAMRDTSSYGALCEKLALTGIQTSITPLRYTCRSGQWFDSNNIPLESELLGATSCMSTGGTTVANGQIIVQGSMTSAWTLDQYNTYGKRIPTVKCSNGNWLNCDAYGNNCTQAGASDGNANLANVLTAVESALKAIIALLGR